MVFAKKRRFFHRLFFSKMDKKMFCEGFERKEAF